MGLMSAITGNAGEVSVTDAAQALGPMLIPQEQVVKAYQVGRVTGNPIPIQREFNNKVNVWEVQTVLAQMVLR
jgi:hypothetical protein